MLLEKGLFFKRKLIFLSKVFLSASLFALLEEERDKAITLAVTRIQSQIRRRVSQLHFEKRQDEEKRRRAAVILQRYSRALAACNRYSHLQELDRQNKEEERQKEEKRLEEDKIRQREDARMRAHQAVSPPIFNGKKGLKGSEDEFYKHSNASGRSTSVNFSKLGVDISAFPLPPQPPNLSRRSKANVGVLAVGNSHLFSLLSC